MTIHTFSRPAGDVSNPRSFGADVEGLGNLILVVLICIDRDVVSCEVPYRCCTRAGFLWNRFFDQQQPFDFTVTAAFGLMIILTSREPARYTLASFWPRWKEVATGMRLSRGDDRVFHRPCHWGCWWQPVELSYRCAAEHQEEARSRVPGGYVEFPFRLAARRLAIQQLSRSSAKKQR